jgi:hypothetical protein
MTEQGEVPRGWPRYATALMAVSGALLGLGVAQIVMSLLGVDGSSWQLGAVAVVLGLSAGAWYAYSTSSEQNWKRDRKRRGLDWRP